MQEKSKETVTLLNELEWLIEAGTAGDLGIILSDEGLNEEESKVIHKINTAMTKFKTTLENDMMAYKMSNDAKSGYLMDMNLEMRTPLNAILGLTGLVLENDALDEETYKNLEKVHNSGAALLGILNNILDIATMNIGAGTIENLKLLQDLDERRYQYKKLERVSLPDARVLVVDDNITNLDVAKGLMQPYDIKVDRVDTGEKAIDAIIAEPDRYDAIFMDQVMPGMDGVATTQHIRELNTDYAKNIPIIALTVNTAVSNEEMLLNNGFQAFLSKPIDIFRLDVILKRWIRDRRIDNQENTSGKKETTQSRETAKKDHGKPVDWLNGKEITGLNFTEGIRRFAGDTNIYLTVLRSFSANTRKILESISTLDMDEKDHYKITVHSIRGSCASIGANVPAAMAKNLEDAAVANDWEFVSEHNAPFISTVKRLINDLESMFAAIDLESPKPKKDIPDKELLKKLRSACESYDMDAVDAVMDKLSEYSYESDDDLIEWLKTNIEGMNFPEVIERLLDI